MIQLNTPPTHPLHIEWGIAMHTAPGETECGDQYVAKTLANGMLFAVIDGLGHGEIAAAAARAAAATLLEDTAESVVTLIQRCHAKLKRTRGAVMSLALFDAAAQNLTWVGIGNVKGVVLRSNSSATPRDWLLVREGVVGYNLPTPRQVVTAVFPGDALVMASDGLHSNYAEKIIPAQSPQHMAEHILAQAARGTDDALVLVAQFKNTEA
jgi:serine/threonine protein phosphatase PrpC